LAELSALEFVRKDKHVATFEKNLTLAKEHLKKNTTCFNQVKKAYKDNPSLSRLQKSEELLILYQTLSNGQTHLLHTLQALAEKIKPIQKLQIRSLINHNLYQKKYTECLATLLSPLDELPLESKEKALLICQQARLQSLVQAATEDQASLKNALASFLQTSRADENSFLESDLYFETQNHLYQQHTLILLEWMKEQSVLVKIWQERLSPLFSLNSQQEKTLARINAYYFKLLEKNEAFLQIPFYDWLAHKLQSLNNALYQQSLQGKACFLENLKKQDASDKAIKETLQQKKAQHESLMELEAQFKDFEKEQDLELESLQLRLTAAFDSRDALLEKKLRPLKLNFSPIAFQYHAALSLKLLKAEDSLSQTLNRYQTLIAQAEKTSRLLKERNLANHQLINEQSSFKVRLTKLLTRLEQANDLLLEKHAIYQGRLIDAARPLREHTEYKVIEGLIARLEQAHDGAPLGTKLALRKALMASMIKRLKLILSDYQALKFESKNAFLKKALSVIKDAILDAPIELLSSHAQSDFFLMLRHQLLRPLCTLLNILAQKTKLTPPVKSTFFATPSEVAISDAASMAACALKNEFKLF
jgi:hypothetical protein